jgi:hypothetical protein
MMIGCMIDPEGKKHRDRRSVNMLVRPQRQTTPLLSGSKGVGMPESSSRLSSVLHRPE